MILPLLPFAVEEMVCGLFQNANDLPGRAVRMQSRNRSTDAEDRRMDPEQESGGGYIGILALTCIHYCV